MKTVPESRKILNKNIRLYWAFYKSTLIINLAVSFAVSLVAGSLYIFSVCFASGGPLFSIFFKEIWRRNEYYFYNNCGISKYQLMAFTMAVSILLGTSILMLLLYVTSS